MTFSRPRLRKSLTIKLLISVSAVVFLSLGIWGYFNVQYIKQKELRDLAGNMDRLGNTIRLGAHYAMMLNSRDDIQQIISNISRQNEIQSIRIYNKSGEIKFSNHANELNRPSQISIEDQACHICHRNDPPASFLSLAQRVRITQSRQGYRLMGIISPIYNETGCATDSCHVHPQDKKVLGALDLEVSLEETDQDILSQQRNLILLAAILLCSTGAIIILINLRFVTKPIHSLINEASRIEKGSPPKFVHLHQQDEMQELANAIHQMGLAIEEKTQALNRQRDEYQKMFETVPCVITVQDREYRLISYNREFSEKFDPLPGAFCYQAYKGRNEKCEDCPVEKTFADGLPHFSEESAPDKDGTMKHWIVRTSPVKDAGGRVVAAMEMNLDITERLHLEEKLRQSEKKYYAIFNTIPNPVFVLTPEELTILDCNDSVQPVYHYSREELLGSCFLDLFIDPVDQQMHKSMTQNLSVDRIKHRTKEGQTRYVTLHLIASEYESRPVLLATISDITKNLEAEQQLIQASKMATLGEMATGVAHELNQPLSVIKTASSYFMRKLRHNEPIDNPVLMTMAEEIDSHVRRATKIIGHMRQFGRKADANLEKVQINDVLTQAFDFFSQQLKVRGIDIVWDIAPDLPMVIGDTARLEQVVINLLVNARDAIEEKWPSGAPAPEAVRKIRLSTSRRGNKVRLSVCDSGIGIEPGLEEKVFEPFFTTKKVGQGTGLGLSISYGIIRECNGDIYARPNPDGGTCFHVEFPIPG